MKVLNLNAVELYKFRGVPLAVSKAQTRDKKAKVEAWLIDYDKNAHAWVLRDKYFPLNYSLDELEKMTA